jgi:ferredoxin
MKPTVMEPAVMEPAAMEPAVVVCADEPRIDVEGAVAVKGLCDSPEQLAHEGIEADRMVLLFHEKRYDLAAVQKSLRSMGIDPLGTQILEVPSSSDPYDASLPLVGLLARASAYAGSEPEHAKPAVRGEVTRRGLFRLPQPVYLSAPMIDHDVCAAADGCRACVDVCPQEAYRWHQGRVHFNKDICEPCGRCVAACPTEAITNPAATPRMLKAQIEALLGRTDNPVGVRFVCSRADRLGQDAGWHDVEVTCSGMVPGTWLVSALLMGAAAVALPGCSTSGCPLALDIHSTTAVDFARSALEAAGLDTDRVRTQPLGDPGPAPIAQLHLDAPFTRAGDVATMLGLSELAEGTLELTHEGTSHGLVAINPETCTLCAKCAQTCPTGAIEAGYDGATITLSFAAAACTNCNQCTIVCPEILRGAITVSSTVDTALLKSGRLTVNQGTVLVCESCGKPIAPSSMMNRIGELLGDGFDDTMSYLTRRCLDCRGLT